MHNRHITHLINRYIDGQLNPSLRARVVNHVHDCDRCRAALARQERIASDLRRDLPALGHPVQGRLPSGQLASVFAGVMSDVQSQRWQDRLPLHTWLPGVTVALVMLLVIAVALPLLGDSGLRVEAAPVQTLQNRPVSTSSPTPGLIETDEARSSVVAAIKPRATVALVSEAGATPAPVPGATGIISIVVSPEARGR